MLKILTVLGARPQFIKASIVSAEFAKHADVSEVVVHTGQHFDTNMSEIFFKELGMAKPDYNLGIHGLTHGAMTGRMLEAVEQILLAEKPNVLLVYGDTNSTLAGALAAAKLHIPVAHVEAGLRSFNVSMPEEINRLLTDHISHWLFTPTDTASKNLLCEGSARERIFQVGDVMYDVALHHGRRVQSTGRVLGRLGLGPGSYVLATVHRAENTDRPDRMAVLIDALNMTAQELPVVWPMHPRTRAALAADGKLAILSRAVHVIQPVGYLDMVQLEKYAAVIATDSGGVQKEAFFHHVPCVTLRSETEWTELVDAGWNRLAPLALAATTAEAINKARNRKGEDVSPYGSGHAAEPILNALLER